MPTYTSKQILEDFKFLISNLEEIHPNPFLFVTKRYLEKDLHNLALQYEDIEGKTFFFELMKIFNKIKDSHTKIKGIEMILSKKKYQLKLKYLNNRYYITSIESGQKENIGSEILSLNNHSFDDIISRMSEIITYENEVVLSNAIERWIYEPDILRYLGVVDKSMELEIQSTKKTFTLLPERELGDKLYSPREIRIKNNETLNPKGLYWTKYFNRLETYYLQYNECENITERKIKKIIEEIINKEIKFVIVDLRNNLGGSSLILDPLTNFLFDNQNKYIPVVFLSNITYSAAIINALNILDCKNSISIGSKTSGSPTKFGQTTTITLPNTRIDVAISTKYFKEKGYLFGQPLAPKIQTNQTVEQYLNAVDIVWEEFLKQRLSLSKTAKII